VLAGNKPAPQEAAMDARVEWYPSIDPITGAPFFMVIEHPEKGDVPTYGGPFSSYTLCERDVNDSSSDEIRFTRERFDHDEGAWVEGCESIGLSLVTQARLSDLAESSARLASRPQSPSAEPRANLISNRKLGKLLELIDKLCRLGNGDDDGNSTGNVIAQQARALLLAADESPSNEKALREALQGAVDLIGEAGPLAWVHAGSFDAPRVWEIKAEAYIKATIALLATERSDHQSAREEPIDLAKRIFLASLPNKGPVGSRVNAIAALIEARDREGRQEAAERNCSRCESYYEQTLCGGNRDKPYRPDHCQFRAAILGESGKEGA
jgi:hypothetical protein